MKNELTSNFKYLSRCQYYGTLIDWEYVSDAMVLVLQTYTATEFYGGQNKIRIYVPTKFQDKLANELEQGENYFIIASPYRVTFKNEYRHRVDMLIAIFKEIL